MQEKPSQVLELQCWWPLTGTTLWASVKRLLCALGQWSLHLQNVIHLSNMRNEETFQRETSSSQHALWWATEHLFQGWPPSTHILSFWWTPNYLTWPLSRTCSVKPINMPVNWGVCGSVHSNVWAPGVVDLHAETIPCTKTSRVRIHLSDTSEPYWDLMRAFDQSLYFYSSRTHFTI